ncbi:hypothetical protein EDE11_1249 [Methylomonas methanica]|uniref:Uncharacterized protein n=1 Tax=Methylomonas methanica TaxID=421 RepID=A0ABY2CHK2_METMH|nr:hypothetical protein EDE11_1249 [Methylomonas methanica]
MIKTKKIVMVIFSAACIFLAETANAYIVLNEVDFFNIYSDQQT